MENMVTLDLNGSLCMLKDVHRRYLGVNQVVIPSRPCKRSLTVTAIRLGICWYILEPTHLVDS